MIYTVHFVAIDTEQVITFHPSIVFTRIFTVVESL